MKEIFFLSGLPRSGSTLLGSIIGQNPDFHVTPTSPLLDLLCFANQNFNMLDKSYTYDKDVISSNVYKGIIEGFYKHIDNKYILDKHRGHPRNLVPLKKFVTDQPKIICTSRPISEIIVSYIKLIEKNEQQDNFIDNTLKKKGIPINIGNRAKCLWEEYIIDPYKSTNFGLNNYRENLHIVEYEKIVSDPDSVLKDIYKFLNIPEYNGHVYDNIHNFCAEEKDAAWGLENLHLIRKNLGKTSTPPEEVLGAYLTDYYNKFNLVY
jgi:sulfotransferase